MKLDVYGRLLEVLRENETWELYSLGEGKKRRVTDIVIPRDLPEAEVIIYIGDIFHEAATPENPEVRVIE